MKKTISTILVCVLLVGTLLSLASCEVFGLVIGTYTDGTTTYEFSGKEVTVTVEGEILGVTLTTTRTGEYEIGENEDGEKTITFTLTDKDGNTSTSTYLFNSGSDDEGSYIELITKTILGSSSSKYYKE